MLREKTVTDFVDAVVAETQQGYIVSDSTLIALSEAVRKSGTDSYILTRIRERAEEHLTGKIAKKLKLNQALLDAEAKVREIQDEIGRL